jgi:hypothetical protein
MRRERTDAGSSDDPDDSEAAYGGADAVEGTTYIVGSGTDPDAPDTGHPGPQVSAQGWTTRAVWIIVALAVLVVVLYGWRILR